MTIQQTARAELDRLLPPRVPWRILCWLYGHKIPPQPSPAAGWWCWRCYQTVHAQDLEMDGTRP